MELKRLGGAKFSILLQEVIDALQKALSTDTGHSTAIRRAPARREPVISRLD
jgi:hypothetical protein